MADGHAATQRETLGDRILSVLTEHDPEGLIAAGAPADEYEAEAKDLAAHLAEHGTVTTDRLAAIWAGWFGTTAALLYPGNQARLDRLTRDLNAIPSARGTGA